MLKEKAFNLLWMRIAFNNPNKTEPNFIQKYSLTSYYFCIYKERG